MEKLKTLSVEDIVLDEMKTQILSIAGVEYSSLSTKVLLYFCQEMGITVPNKTRKKEEITELILNHISRRVLKAKRDRQAAHEEEGKSCKDLPSSIDERWNALSNHQHQMFYQRKTAFPEHEKSHVTCYSRQWGEEHVLV